MKIQLTTWYLFLTCFSLLYHFVVRIKTCTKYHIYGAELYHFLGKYLQKAVIVTTLIDIPLAFFWAFRGKILKMIGQNKDISMVDGLYAQ